jgi:hypothetical protein
MEGKTEGKTEGNGGKSNCIIRLSDISELTPNDISAFANTLVNRDGLGLLSNV